MKTVINTKNAPAPIGAYNQSVKFGNFLFVSGQIPFDPKTGEHVNESIEMETTQVMENIKAILEEAKMDFSNVLKTSIFISAMNSFASINSVYEKYFKEGEEPARECVEVSKLPKNVNVEISLIAAK